MDIEMLKSVVKEGVEPLQKDLAELKSIPQAVKGLDERLGKIENSPLIKNVPVVRSSKYKGYKLNEQMRGIRNFANAHKQDFSVFNSDESAEDFAKFMIDFIKVKFGKDMSAQEGLKEFYQKANMVEGTAANGGYLVPDIFVWDMVMLARQQTMFNDCTIIPMNSDQVYLPKELTLASVAWTAPESGTITAGEPTFDQVSLAAKRLDGIATVTNELLMDSAIDVVGMLTEQFGYAIAAELDNQIFNGTGSPVSGLLTAAAGYSAVFATTSTNFSAITAYDLSNAIYKLANGDQVGAKFYINKIGLHYMRSLKDTNDRPIFAEIAGPVPGTIYGYPYFVEEKITNTSAVSTALGLFGNMKKFYLGRRLGVTSLDVDPYGLFTTYMTRFRIATRWALAVGRSTAFCRIMTPAD